MNQVKTDRELLELAAKAAGIEVDAVVNDGVPNRFGGGYWNPLTDDGDALRLAVKLGMNCALIPPSIENSFCEIAAFFDDAGWPSVRAHEPHGDDPYAATRRAIVRAAAAIGEYNK